MVKNISICVLIALTATNIAVAQNDSDAVVQTLQSYAAASQSMNLDEMEKYVVTTDDYSVFEGGHINWGWTDYRDHHLGPEFKEFLKFQYSYQDIKAHVMGKMAYATLKYDIAIKTKKREINGEGLATVVLTKNDGAWRILHMHTSRIPKREH